jgi:hypothetical protein
MGKLIIRLAALAVGLGSVLLIGILLSWPVYMLWNGCLVDAVAGVKEVTWLQAWGITVLCNIFFKTSLSES